MSYSNSTYKPWSPIPSTKSNRVSSSKNYKSKDFMESLNKTISETYDNFSMTENGALGFKTTGHALLDLNFEVASLRKESDTTIINKFKKAYMENPELAMRWLFFLRDVRGGLGERRSFRIIFKDIASACPNFVKGFLYLVPEYGRYDDLWELLTIHSMSKYVTTFVHDQMLIDYANMKNNKPISLLAKWMPSLNTSSETTRKYAGIIAKALNISPRDYRKLLSEMRAYLNVVEQKMSAQKWTEIDYEAVPSKANLLYNNAFLRHDEDRRRSFLNALSNGEAKINSSVAFPHDIVHQYYKDQSVCWSVRLSRTDATLEGMWKALPNLIKGNNNTIVVADGSGSMRSVIDRNSSLTALEVCNALAIYFAEHCNGVFHDKYITFSSRPQYVDFSGANTLHDKLVIAARHTECSNTNIEAVFDMILKTAISNHLSQNDLPANILVMSD